MSMRRFRKKCPTSFNRAGYCLQIRWKHSSIAQPVDTWQLQYKPFCFGSQVCARFISSSSHLHTHQPQDSVWPGN